MSEEDKGYDDGALVSTKKYHKIMKKMKKESITEDWETQKTHLTFLANEPRVTSSRYFARVLLSIIKCLEKLEKTKAKE